jgi:hypothetical protein
MVWCVSTHLCLWCAAFSVVTEEFNPLAGGIALISFALCTYLPIHYPKFPAPICTVAALTLATVAFQLPVATLSIPDTFFEWSVSIPAVKASDISMLISNSALVFTLSSMVGRWGVVLVVVDVSSSF